MALLRRAGRADSGGRRGRALKAVFHTAHGSNSALHSASGGNLKLAWTLNLQRHEDPVSCPPNFVFGLCMCAVRRRGRGCGRPQACRHAGALHAWQDEAVAQVNAASRRHHRRRASWRAAMAVGPAIQQPRHHLHLDEAHLPRRREKGGASRSTTTPSRAAKITATCLRTGTHSCLSWSRPSTRTGERPQVVRCDQPQVRQPLDHPHRALQPPRTGRARRHLAWGRGVGVQQRGARRRSLRARRQTTWSAANSGGTLDLSRSHRLRTTEHGVQFVRGGR